MKRSFGQVLRKVIDESDIIIEVVDARLLDLTRNELVESLVEQQNKRLIICVNKCDLVEKSYLEKKVKGLKNCVFVSSRLRYGTKILREMIYSVSAKSKKEKILVGVVGYPNTGKSSVINALKGRTSAPMSSRSGRTKGAQKVRISSRVMLLDSPGVIPINQQDSVQLALIASKNADRVKDIDLVAQTILDTLHEQQKWKVLEKFFSVTLKNKDSALEELAIAKNRLKKGGQPDIQTISRFIIQAWQKGLL
ncbi:MAG: GTPase [Candidatus Woesearchaeota archaeon]